MRHRVLLIIMVVTCTVSVTAAPRAALAGIRDGEDEELVNKRDEEVYDDDDDEEISVVDVDDHKSKRDEPPCTPWIPEQNTKVDDGQRHDASTLTNCQAACVGKPKCTGYDWAAGEKKGHQCWLAGPWSAGRSKKPGVIHYDRDRKCEGLCKYKWSKKITNAISGTAADARTLEDCRNMCINSAECTAWDYRPLNKPVKLIMLLMRVPLSSPNCWLVVPSSRRKSDRIVLKSIQHFDLTRECTANIKFTENEKVEKDKEETKLEDAVAGNTYFHQNAKFDGETEEPESGVSGTTVVIVLLVVALLIGAGVTAFAYQKKILCFEDSSGAGDEEEATGDESPLLKDATSASQLSPSRATSASGTTLNKSRPSGTTAYGSD